MEIQKFENSPFDNGVDFNPVKSILIVVVFLLFIASIWFSITQMGKKSPETSTQATSTSPRIFISSEKSLYNGWVKITDTSAAGETYPQKEFIIITVTQQNLTAVDASEWSLVNKDGDGAKLGKFAEIPSFGKINTLTPIKINGGDTLIVLTGSSPIGVSFRTNLCTPYFEQFQDFVPAIPTGECPYATNDRTFGTLDGACQGYINTLPICQTVPTKLPAGVSAECKAYIDAHVSYRGCVADNQSNGRFFSNEIRLFLGRSRELWRLGDTITLIDGQGKIIDSVRF